MEAIARLNNIPTSTRKMRLVVNLIRGERVSRALNILKFDPKIGAPRIEKLLLSAIANWQDKNEEVNLEEADLYIKEIFVDGGRMLKRLRPAPQGRAHRIRKRSNHVTLVVDSLNQVVEVEEAAAVEEKPKTKAKTKKESGAKAKEGGKEKKAKEDKKATAPEAKIATEKDTNAATKKAATKKKKDTKNTKESKS